MLIPIIIHDVIIYIEEGEKTVGMSICYFLFVFCIKLIMCLSETSLLYCFDVLAFNISNILSSMIFKKTLMYPIYTEKEF